MLKPIATPYAAIALAVMLTGLCPPMARADDAIEEAGVAVGMTAGNMWVIPAKALSTSMGLFFGTLSFVLTGGNADLTQQIWRDTTQGPYLITPEVAHKAIGDRPLLEEKGD
jgi:hypothetical protein